jgi:hypothetical protein
MLGLELMPLQRDHVAANLHLDNAFMSGKQAGVVGNILLSQGAGVAPVWLINGPMGSILMSMGPGSNPVWVPNPICSSPTQSRRDALVGSHLNIRHCGNKLM